MANPADRLPENVAGPYYVDSTCIYCDLCVELYPNLFRMIGNSEWAIVYHQPTSQKEIEEADDAIECCPTESIGRDSNPQNPE